MSPTTSLFTALIRLATASLARCAHAFMTYDVGTGSSFVPFFTLFTLNHTSYTPPELQGKLYTWGGGTYGKLGQMDKVNSLTPRPVKNVTTGAHFVQVRYSAPAFGTRHWPFWAMCISRLALETRH